LIESFTASINYANKMVLEEVIDSFEKHMKVFLVDDIQNIEPEKAESFKEWYKDMQASNWKKKIIIDSSEKIREEQRSRDL
jgi:hypothetical protein